MARGPEQFPGERIHAEVHGPLGQLLGFGQRDVLLWASVADGQRAHLFVRSAGEEWDRWMGEVGAADVQLLRALAPIRRMVTRPARARAAGVGRACEAVSRAAERHGWLQTALAYQQLAALLAPDSGAVAVDVGRLAAAVLEYAGAEVWFRRAVVLARREGDWEAYACGVEGLAELYEARGDVDAAEHFRERAGHVVKRHRLRPKGQRRTARAARAAGAGPQASGSGRAEVAGTHAVSRMLLLHRSKQVRARIRAAVGDAFRITSVASWEDLRWRVAELAGTPVVVVEPDFGLERVTPSRGPAVELYGLMQAYPSLAVVAAVRLHPDDGDALRRLGTFGVAGVVFLGHDDGPVALRWYLREARMSVMRTIIERVVPPWLSGRGRLLLEQAAEVVRSGERGDALASRLGLSRKGLLRWCVRAGVPGPKHLLSWLRVLHAALMIDEPGRLVDDAARAAGYHSDAALRRIMRTMVGRSPKEARADGAFDTVAAAFRGELERLRVGRDPYASFFL